MKNTFLTLMLCGAFLTTTHAQQNATLPARFDSIVNAHFTTNEAGASVLVSRNGKVIYQKAAGQANVELSVPTRVDNVFRLASITKQFTAVAILQLMEQGKLNLQDDITRFIPDYPTLGATINVEHLLTHTSGISDYTAIEDTVHRGTVDVTPEEMIRFFQNLPMRFAPGSRYEYSNSNYFLLGYIIETLTGKPYANYLEDNFFKPLGMRNSYYASDTRLITNRAAGYTLGTNGLENAPAISMTRPYAAGSILSTTSDMFKWHTALLSQKLIKKSSLEKAMTRHKLASGEEIEYGYGFRMGFIQRSHSVWHGGLINGSRTMAIYLPKEDVYVTVLSNCDCGPSDKVALLLAAVAIDKPFTEKEITLPESLLKTYAGEYENEKGDRISVTLENGQVNVERGRSPKAVVKAFKKDNFFFDNPMITAEFVANGNGGIDTLVIASPSKVEVWLKSDKEVLDATAVKVDEKILEAYAGQYEVNAHFSFSVTNENGRLFLQAPGQEKLEMFAEANDKFYLAVNDARFQFVAESGKTVKIILSQGGRTTDAIKVK